MRTRHGSSAVALSLLLGLLFTFIVTQAAVVRAEEPAPSAAPPAGATDGSQDGDASTPPNDEPRNTVPVSTSVTLPNKVVTPTKTPTPVEQVGSAFSVIRAADLRAHQHRVATDALRFVPGVDVRQTGGPGSQVSIFTRGTNSNHTKMLLDGIELADPSTAGAIALPQFLLTTGVDRIEVLRGPQSALYGSDAIGGVANLTTPRGEGPFSVWYTQEVGTYRTFLEQLSASAGDETFSFSVHGAHLDTRNISSKSNNDEADPHRNATVRSRFAWTPSDVFEVDFYLHGTRTENEFDGFGDIDLSQTDGEFLFFKVAPKLHLADGDWTSTLNLSHARHDRESFDGGTTHFDGRVFDLDWQNDLAMFDGHLVTFGFAYRHEYGEETGGFNPYDASRDVFAFYLQDQITLIDHLTVTPGVRVDHYSDFGTHATFRLAAAYHLVDTNTIFRASVGTGFNAPAFNQLEGFGSNPDLDPEKTLSFDVGVEQRLWDERAVIGATYFHTSFDDLIVAIDTGGFNFVNFNIEEAKSRGVEVFAAVEPVAGLVVRGTYTFNPTEAEQIVAFSSLAIMEGDPLLRRPKHKGSLEVIYTFWQERATAALSVVYVGQREDVGGVTAEDYVVVDLAGSVKVHDNVELFARVENLLDNDYEDVVGFNTPGVAAYGGFRIGF